MTAALERAAQAATRGDAATWAVLSAVHAWLGELAQEPVHAGSDGSVWRVSWGMPDQATGLPTARVARLGRDPSVLTPAFGHVFVPDGLRADESWVEAQARRALGVPPPPPPLVAPGSWSTPSPGPGQPWGPGAPPAEDAAVEASSDHGAGLTVTPQQDPPRTEAAVPAAAPPVAPLRASSLLRPVSRLDASPASTGWRVWLNRASVGLLRLPPGPAEHAERSDRAEVQRSFGRPVSVVFANPKGGGGKTTCTLLAAATFGTHRGGGVVAWDCNETRGTLGLRALPDAPTTVWDLLGHLDQFERADARIGDLAAYLRGQGEARFDVLASDEDAANMAQVDGGACDRILTVLQRYYKITCIDTGNNLRASNWQAVIATADLLVVCSSYEQDQAYSAAWMLDHLEAAGHADLVANAVTVLSAASPAVTAEARTRVEEHFTARTRAVTHIPYDPVVKPGDVITYAALRPATRRAWLGACAAMASGLASGRDRVAAGGRVGPEAGP